MKKRGYALPLSLCVAGVTLMLGLSAAQMTNGDLGLANHQYYQERARQAADFGLEYCVAHQVTPGQAFVVPSQSGTHPFDSVVVRMYSHGQAGAPLDVPQGFEYWVAEGRAAERANSNPVASARVGALVRYGRPAGTSGAQARTVRFRSQQAVDLQAYDGIQRAPVLGQPICSSEYQGSGDYFLFPGQTYPIELGQVGATSGSFRIPSGADRNLVHVTTTLDSGLPVVQDGGPINVPTYTPPTGLPYLGVKQVTAGYRGPLESGHYQTLEIPADADVTLNGTYHFDNLTLAAGVSVGQGGTLRVAASQDAKVFVDRMNLGHGSLGLTNENTSAQSFRFTVRASRPPADAPSPPVLNFKLPGGGGVALVADGHHVRLESDASREIRGAFSANAIEAMFQDPSGPFTRPPVFVYDVSASTARRAAAQASDPPNQVQGGGGDPSRPSGDPSRPENFDPAGPVRHPRVPPESSRTGLEPMILSRQPL